MTHMIQYAFVGDTMVPDTSGMNDDEVKARARKGGAAIGAVERYNRCPECEAWTTVAGRLRADLDCPAVKAGLAGG